MKLFHLKKWVLLTICVLAIKFKIYCNANRPDLPLSFLSFLPKLKRKKHKNQVIYFSGSFRSIGVWLAQQWLSIESFFFYLNLFLPFFLCVFFVGSIFYLCSFCLKFPFCLFVFSSFFSVYLWSPPPILLHLINPH